MILHHYRFSIRQTASLVQRIESFHIKAREQAKGLPEFPRDLFATISESMLGLPGLIFKEFVAFIINLPPITNGIRQIYQLQASAYLMPREQESKKQQRTAQECLQAIQGKLSLMAFSREQVPRSLHHSDEDSLFASNANENSFNQLFNNSLHHNPNFSQIGQQEYQDDSLFGNTGGCFQEDRSRPILGDDCFLLNAPLKDHMKIQQKEESEEGCSLDGRDTRTKILQILKMKDRMNKIAANKSTDSQRENLNNRHSSNSLVLKPKLIQNTQNSHSAIKLARRASKDHLGIANRVKTQSNDRFAPSNCRVNQICRTDYDEVNDQQNTFNVITEENDSLECTFKPTILKECLLSINQNIKPKLTKINQNPPRKSNQKGIKMQKTATPAFSLKAKSGENSQKSSTDTQSTKTGLSKKSSIQASASTLDVAARNQLWLMQREERLMQKRKQDQQEKLKQEDFSFKPVINQYRKDQKTSTSKTNDKETVPPFFERLSMAKRKSTGVKWKKEQSIQVLKTIDQVKEKNKQNLLSIVNYEKDSSQILKNKKQSYEQAVKELHHKIMKMNL